MPGPQYTQAVANALLSLFGQKSIPERQREAYQSMGQALTGGGGGMGGGGMGGGGMGGGGGVTGGQAMANIGGGGMQTNPGMMDIIDKIGAYDPGRALAMMEQLTVKSLEPTKVPEQIQRYNYFRRLGAPHEEASRLSIGENRSQYNTPVGELEDITRATTKTPKLETVLRDNATGNPLAKREDAVMEQGHENELEQIEARADEQRAVIDYEEGARRNREAESRGRARIQYAVDEFSNPNKIENTIALHNNLNFLFERKNLQKVFDLYNSGWFPGIDWIAFRAKKGFFGANEYNDVAARIEQIIGQKGLPQLKALVGGSGISDRDVDLVLGSATTLNGKVSGLEAMRQVMTLQDNINILVDQMFDDALKGEVPATIVERNRRRLRRNESP